MEKVQVDWEELNNLLFFIEDNGEKSVINLMKLVLAFGGIVGGSFDYTSTKIIASRDEKLFGDSAIINVNALD